MKKLTRENLFEIVGKCLGALNQRLRDRGIALSLSPEAIAWTVDKGYNPEYGARELERTIETQISKPLAEEIINGSVPTGRKITVHLVNDALEFRAIS